MLSVVRNKINKQPSSNGCIDFYNIMISIHDVSILILLNSIYIKRCLDKKGPDFCS